MIQKCLNEATMPTKGALIDTVDNLISIDEFMPKTGHEFNIIVVAFYISDQNAAEDFRMFIERGTAEFKDIEVSPNPDTDGKWLVFVELERNEDFWKKLDFICKEVARLTGQKHQWQVRTYFTDNNAHPIDEIKDKIELLSSKYAIHKFKGKGSDVTNENLELFFSDSLLENFSVSGTEIEFRRGTAKLCMRVENYGDHESLIESIGGSGYDLLNRAPYEVTVLHQMLGPKYTVNNSGNQIYVEHIDRDSLLILNTYR